MVQYKQIYKDLRQLELKDLECKKLSSESRVLTHIVVESQQLQENINLP